MKLNEVEVREITEKEMRACRKLSDTWKEKYCGTYDISTDYLEMVEELTGLDQYKLINLSGYDYEVYEYEFSEDTAAYVMFGFLTPQLKQFLLDLKIIEVEVKEEDLVD